MRKLTFLFVFFLFAFAGYGQCTFTVNANPSDEGCPNACDGRIKIVSVSGGVSPYSYSWSTGDTTTTIKNLCPATYTLVVTDNNGCKDTLSYMISPASFNVAITKNNLTCFNTCDGNISATPSGGNPAYTYSWAPGGQTSASISNLCAGNYTLTLTDSKNNCTITRVVSITEPTQLTSTVTSTPASCGGCADGTATISANGGNKPYDYLWLPGNATTSKITNATAGTYTACVTDKNGCKVCKTVTITSGPAGINPSETPATIAVYPNPATDQLHISSPSLKSISFSLFDITRAKVQLAQATQKADALVLDITQIPPGIYFLHLEINGKKGMRKILKTD